MKTIRTEPHDHGAKGDERNRTAVGAPGADPVYEACFYDGVEYGTDRPCRIGRVTYRRDAHRYIALTFRYLDEPADWQLTWIGVEGHDAVRLPRGVKPPDDMVAALDSATPEAVS